MVARYWRRKAHSIQILNTIYESLFIVDTNFIGNQYYANVTERDPINDTTFLTPYFILVEISHTEWSNIFLFKTKCGLTKVYVTFDIRI
jgi:hypothetical protein